jgi:sugar lactone lactonase YvrE
LRFAGGLWSCNITAGKVTRYDPDSGTPTFEVITPNVSARSCTLNSVQRVQRAKLQCPAGTAALPWDSDVYHNISCCASQRCTQVSTPTCVAFGGANLDTLFITSLDGARNGLAAEGVEPHAGSLFAVQHVGYCGLPEPLFEY